MMRVVRRWISFRVIPASLSRDVCELSLPGAKLSLRPYLVSLVRRSPQLDMNDHRRPAAQVFVAGVHRVRSQCALKTAVHRGGACDANERPFGLSNGPHDRYLQSFMAALDEDCWDRVRFPLFFDSSWRSTNFEGTRDGHVRRPGVVE